MTTATKYRLRIISDSDCENPCDCDGTWTLHSFNRDHINFTHPDEFFHPSGKPKLQIANKLRHGLAFLLSYHEHGLCVWSLIGQGPRCPWDTVDGAGIAIWNNPPEDMGAKTVDERAKDCAAQLRTYTDWCNGNCWSYSIEDADGNHLDSCFGYIGDYVCEAAAEALPEDATEDNTDFECHYEAFQDYEVFKHRTKKLAAV